MLSSEKLDALAHGINLLKKIGKNLPFIVLAFAGVNVILAIFDYSSRNYGFAILNTIFAVGGINFFIQLLKRRNIHSYDYHTPNIAENS
jgi:uncharacterized membrane-anchored protein YitT (DUF2179 family)